ncbi:MULTISPECIES: molybdopterin synthase sulfur carrier subunit [Oceanisphaera]|uniref:Molybdopterin synthase sulfur carrier subunit n=1 Tax=Oceanisphaera ostreae TaxID=914151 RepID=A0ABW3KGM6_9GAMM
MSITVVFFARVREQLGQDTLELSGDFDNVDAVRQHLVARGAPWSSALGSHQLLTAVNHTIVAMSSPVKAGDEVAFFPPVTGG